MADSLPERFIQDAVAERLNDRYYRRRPAYVNTEVYTRLKRADVLLAFMRAPGRPYVVVVEAKSRTTIHQLKLRHNARKASWTGRLLALLLIVGLSVFVGYEWYFNAWNTLLLLAVFLLGSAAITALIKQLGLSFTRSISAIRQLGQYPANESWIAVGSDTFVRAAEAATLRQQCRKNGVGLIVVDPRGKLSLKVIPRPRHTFNDYLSRYGKRKDILATIDNNPDYGPTRAERRQNRRRFLNVAVLLALVGALVLLGYEESYGPVVPDPFNDPRYASPRSLRIPSSAENETGDFSPAAPPPVPPPDCPAVPLNEQRYVVIDAILPREAANQRLSTLRAAGLRGHDLLPAACLVGTGASDKLVVYTGKLYPGAERAEATAAAYRDLLERALVPRVQAEVGRLRTD